MTVRMMTLFLIVSILGTACSDGSSERVAIIEAMATDVVFAADPVTTNVGAAECLAQGVYDALGAERLAEAGISVASPSIANSSLLDPERSMIGDMAEVCISQIPVPPTPTPENQSVATQRFAASLRRTYGYEGNKVNCIAQDFIATETDGLIVFNGDWTSAEHSRLIDAMGRCDDIVTIFAEGLLAENLTPAVATCVAEELGAGQVTSILKAVIGDDNNAPWSGQDTPYGRAVASCGSGA